MVNSRKILTIVAKNSTLDVPGRGLTFGMLTGLYIWEAYIQGLLMYRGHNNWILRYFHLESKQYFIFKTVQ